MIPWTGVVEFDIVKRVDKVSSKKIGVGGMEEISRMRSRVSYTK